MVRFIHCADLHLDSPLRGLVRYADAPVDALRQATRRAVTRLVDLALAREVDFVIVAGDVYDGDWRDHHTGLFFAQEMARLTRADIPVYLLAGNHDAANVITRSLRLPDGVFRFDDEQPNTFQHPRLPVSLHGQGFRNRVENHNLTEHYPAPTPGHFNIGVLHTSLTGRPGHDTYAPCTLDDLRRLGYDYWALGHVHAREKVNSDPPAWFPGNVQGRHIRETGPKGCLLVEVDSGAAPRVSFEAVDVLRWEHLEIDVSDVQEFEEVLDRLQETLARSLSELDRDLLAVRITLAGASPLHDLLIGSHDRLRAEAQRVVHELDPERLWIERVRIKTQAALDSPSLDLTGPEEALRDVMQELLANPATRAELVHEVDDLLRKLPAELFDGAEWPDPREDAHLVAILEELPRHIRARLRRNEEEAP